MAGPPEVCPNRITFPLEEGKLRIRVTLRDPASLPLVGDWLSLKGFLRVPSPPRNPGEFDYGRYLWVHHFEAAFSTRIPPVNLGDSGRFPLKRMAHKLELNVVGSFKRSLPPEEAAVLAGLTLGIRPHDFPELEKSFSLSGTIHVLVASGFKVAFVIGFWMLLARWLLRLPLSAALAGSIPWAFLYSFIVGNEPPVARSCLMATAGILGFLLAREDRAYHSLGLAALVLLLWDPRSLFDLSFQMSFAAVFGLIHFAPVIAVAGRLLSGRGTAPGLRPDSPRLRGAPPPLLSLFQLALTSLAAQLWLLPIMAVHFHQVPLLAPFSNLIAIPLSAAGLPAGFLLAVLERAAPHSLVFYVTRIAAHCITASLIWTAKAFAVAHWVPVPRPGWIFLYYAVLFCVPFWGRSAFCRWAVGLGVAALLFCPAGRPVGPGVTWLDVGDEMAVVVHGGKTAETFLIYGGDPRSHRSGRFNAVERIILPYLAERGVSRLSAVLLSGPLPCDELRRLAETIPVDGFATAKAGWRGRVGPTQIFCLASEPPTFEFSIGQERILQWPGRSLFDLTPRRLAEIRPSMIIVSSKQPTPRFYYGTPVFCTSDRGPVFLEAGRNPMIFCPRK